MADNKEQRKSLTSQQMKNLRVELEEMEQESEIINKEQQARKKRMAQKRKKNKQRKKRLLIIKIAAVIVGILVIIGIALAIKTSIDKKHTEEETQRLKEEQIAAEKAKAEEELRKLDVHLSAVGDNLISQRILDDAYDNGVYDFSSVYSGTVPFLKEHEINWIDVETTINDEIAPSGYPTFSTPGEDGEALMNAGFNVFNLANNHVYDLGNAAILAAERYWGKYTDKNICVTGFNRILTSVPAEDDFTSKYYESGEPPQPNVDFRSIPIYTCENGKTVAFLTYVDQTNSVYEDSASNFAIPEESESRVIYTYELELIYAQIQAADAVADAVVVSCHWGKEDSHDITDSQRAIAQFIADSGADLIIGDHPHVVQDGEWILANDGRKVFCAYSLGNYVSTQESADNLVGAALDCTLRFAGPDAATDAPEVTIVDPKLVPIITVYGENASESHVIMFSDFTDEMAKGHGIHYYDFAPFTKASIMEMLKGVISKEFLDL